MEFKVGDKVKYIGDHYNQVLRESKLYITRIDIGDVWPVEICIEGYKLESYPCLESELELENIEVK